MIPCIHVLGQAAILWPTQKGSYMACLLTSAPWTILVDRCLLVIALVKRKRVNKQPCLAVHVLRVILRRSDSTSNLI